MSQNFDYLVHHSISITLENMAFMEVSADLTESPPLSETETLSARLLVLDPLQAEIQLTLAVSLLRKIIEIVHAFPEDEVVETILPDMVGEMLNTVAGRLLNDLLPESQSYRLGLPEVGGVEETSGEGPTKTWNYQVENEPLALTITGPGLFSSSGDGD
jgi:hypothetical protein